MKLPGYEYQTSPSLRAPMPQRASTGTNAIGAAVGDIGGSLSTLGGVQAALERKAEAARDALEADKIEADMQNEYSRLKDSLTDTEGAAVQGARVQEELTNWLGTRVEVIIDENRRKAVLGEGLKLAAKYGYSARGIATERIVKGTQTEYYKQKEALEARGDEESLQELLDLTSGLTEAGIFSAGEGETLRRSARSGSLGNAFGEDVLTDPDLAASKVLGGEGIYRILTPAERTVYTERAKNEAASRAQENEAYDASIQAEAMRELKVAENNLEAMWGRNEVELIDQFLNAPSTDPRIITMAARRGVIKPDFKSVNELVASLRTIRAEANNYNDPDTLRDVHTRLYNATGPKISQKELLTLRKHRMLSDDEYKSGLKVIKDSYETGVVQAGQLRAPAFTSGRQAIDDWFTTVGESLPDDKQAILALKGQALQDYYRLTKGGKLDGADPEEAASFVMQKFRAVGKGVAKTFLQQVPAQYRKDPKALQREWKAGRVSESDYRRWSAFLVNANDIVPIAEWPSLDQPATTPTAPAGSSAPSPQLQPQAGGRKPPQRRQ